MRSNLTIFAILTTVTIITWIAFDTYRRLNKPGVQPIPEKVLAPINPSLDTKILDNITERRAFSDEEVSLFVPEASPEAEASPSGEAQ